jgi:hypothetical protein
LQAARRPDFYCKEVTGATIWSQCRLRNSFQVIFRLRSGAGSMPCLFRMFAIVLCAST